MVIAVDDSSEDLVLLREAWREACVAAPLWTTGVPDDALARVADRRECVELLIVDQNMPRVTGAEFVARVRGEMGLVTPAIVLSTSSDPRDVETCYRAGANAYVVKPQGLDAFVDAVRCIDAFWLRVNSCLARR